MKIVSFFLWLISLFFYFTTPGEIKSVHLILCLLVGLVLMIIYFYKINNDKKLQQNYFRPSILFLVSFIIVSFQVPLDFILGNLNVYDLDVALFNSNLLNKTVSLSLIGMSSLFLGYFFLSKTRIRKKEENIYYNYNKYINASLIICSYVMFFFFINNVGIEYLSGLYAGSTNWGKGAGWFNKFFEGFIYSSFIYKFYCNKSFVKYNNIKNIFKYIEFIGLPLLILLIIYMSISFYVGDRGPLISFILLFSVGYVIKYRIKVKLIFFIISIFLFSSVLFLIGITRNTDKDSILSNNEKYVEFKNNPSISPLTSELAGSILPLSIALDVVPKKEPYKYGLFQANQVIITFPGIFGLYFSSLGYDKIEDDYLFDSAKYLTRIYLGKFPTWGVGSNCIADLYLDFGFLGVIVGMFLFGLFLRRMDIALNPRNFKNLSLFTAVLFFIYFSKLLYIPRSMVLTPFSDSLFVFFILWIVSKINVIRK